MFETAVLKGARGTRLWWPNRNRSSSSAAAVLNGGTLTFLWIWPFLRRAPRRRQGRGQRAQPPQPQMPSDARSKGRESVSASAPAARRGERLPRYRTPSP